MRSTLKRIRGRRPAVALLLSMTLVAAACSSKKEDTAVGTDPPASTVAGGDTTTPILTTPPTEAEVKPVRGGTLRIGGEAEVGAPWTPSLVQCDSYCYMRAFSFYDPLVVIDYDLEPRPYLAESITPNDDFTVFTIKIRKGIKFHDGTPLDADAVIYNINETLTSFLTGPALQDFAKGADGKAVTEKIDNLTFTIATGRNGDPNKPIPWPLLPYGMSKQTGFMASPKWLQSVKDGTGDAAKPVGTGPFKLETYRPGDSLVAVRNEDYWMKDENGEQLPYLDKIEFRVLPDAQVRQQALESGDVDLIATSDGRTLAALSENDEFNTVLQEKYMETAHTLLHLTKPVLKSKEVRCALAQAVDRDALIDVVQGGFFDKANGPFSPGQEGYLRDSGFPEYDPEAASAAIEAYEAENGPVAITYMTVATTTTKLQADFFVDAWKAIGVDAKTAQVEQSELIVNAITGSDVFEAFGWRNHGGEFVDQQEFWWTKRTAADDGSLGLNFARMKDDVIEKNLIKARTSTDPAERQEAAEAINRRFAEQCYIIPTWWVRWGIVSTPDVTNIGRSPLPGGGFALDGAGFAGQIWTTAVFKQEG